jgi:hypothetical protein
VEATGLGNKRNVYRVLVGKPKGKRPLERPKCRREDIEEGSHIPGQQHAVSS